MNTTFEDLLRQFRELGKTRKSERDKGASFEVFCVKLLRAWDRFNNFERVDLWSDWGFKESDCGIDIVAKTNSGKYIAVQCKCYDEETKLDLNRISTFIASANRSFDTDKDKVSFAELILIDTAKDLTDTAQNALSNLEKPTIRIDYIQIAEANIDWDKFEKEQEISFSPKKQLRQHQIEAIEAITKQFRETDRTKLVMACGTGKSLTAIRLFDKMLNKGEIAVFFAPSIALVAQTLKESFEQSELKFRGFVVCSDAKVGSNDNEDIKAYELPIAPTTNAERLAEFIRTDLDKNERVIIFSTYQSIDVVIEAQRLLNKDFSLIVCDEAHRTAGFKITPKDEAQAKLESVFQKVHSNDNIKANKRLYMSATPKIFSDNTKSKAKKDVEVELYSMDDESIFGSTAYQLDFAKALALGLLTEYKVLITIINQDEVVAVTNQLSKAKKEGYVNLHINGKEVPVDVELIGKVIATYKSIMKNDVYTIDSQGNKEQLSEDTTKIMQRAIAFNNSIKASQTRQSVFKPAIDLYNDLVKNETQSIAVDHIDGTMNQTIKNQKLAWLKDKDQQIRILSNARCLTEGVDVPALDAVVFFDARDSMVDIVQAVGRVMRKAEGKDYGYIILPIMLENKKEAEYDKILDSDKFKLVWKVLKAIRSHDSSLVSEVEFVKKIKLNVVTDIITSERSKIQNSTDGIEADMLDQKADPNKPKEYTQEDLFTAIYLEDLAKSMYAIIPNKLGDREYWKSFAKNVAKIVPALENRIKELLKSDASIQKEFAKFLQALRTNINASIKEQDATAMLVQHIITRPIFEAIFPDGEFKIKNAVSKSMEKVYEKLQKCALSDETTSLSSLYKSIGENAEYAKSDKEKQEIIKNLYDNFFNSAFKKESEKLGIVYTPIEVVDFIIHSVNHALKKYFGKELKDKNVNILDGFTGTGTFIVRLIQSGLLNSNLEHKYKKELHANEITLLAYYIANLNIAAAYHHQLGQANSKNYLMPPKLLLTDTFQIAEDRELLPSIDDEILGENKDRIIAQRKDPINVIIGNPPYSVGQKSGNDDNKNTHYPMLFSKIADTYAKYSTATNQNSLYDSYKLAIRWASDRIKTGIIGYVTNGSFIDGNSDDGLRACLEKEFSHIYVLNLRGNQRTQGEESRQEGGKIFGGGSRTPVAITLLIRDDKHKQGDKAKIYYYDIGDYLSREQKLGYLYQWKDISRVNFTKLEPNRFNDWINPRDESFERYVEIANKDTKFKDGLDIFKVFSMGVVTARDVWAYNFSKDNLLKNIQSCITFYNIERARYAKDKTYNIDMNPKKISWSRKALNYCKGNKEINFSSNKARFCLYRPYSRTWLYCDKSLNEDHHQTDKIFPFDDSIEPTKSAINNLAMVITGTSVSVEFSPLITNIATDYSFIASGQILPLYYYEKVDPNSILDNGNNTDTYERKDAIRDWALAEFQKAYKDDKITKEDIFYYIYGLFHSKEYVNKFKNNLSKMLPRIPFCKDFWGFSKAGRELAYLHLNYETIEIKQSTAKYNTTVSKTEQTALFDEPEYLAESDYKVSKMKFAKNVKIAHKPSTIIYNTKINITNIPAKAYDYVVNGKPALSWIMERYQVKTDDASGITNDPNLYSEDPRYILDLMLKVIEVSVRSVDLINSLPKLEIIEN
ncbi:type ISP restriction/modification enzyme [Helicobacter acinonychis]|uniref:type ISP restriction/modification enzyme n=1 Tax=Helicobacter acinonychis TaxID=212 RepID=UPI000CF0798A|nr:type ISP restriction/modification enzyme [Helicobacter acinonychis]